MIQTKFGFNWSSSFRVRVTNRSHSHSTYGNKLKFSLSEYFNFLFAYLVITYYSLQFVSNGDTK
jgi:hypothetical protein